MLAPRSSDLLLDLADSMDQTNFFDILDNKICRLCSCEPCQCPVWESDDDTAEMFNRHDADGCYYCNLPGKIYRDYTGGDVEICDNCIPLDE